MNARQFIGVLAIVLGAIALFLTIVFSSYYEERFTIIGALARVLFPYASYPLPSAIIGTLLLVVGIFFIRVKVGPKKKSYSTPELLRTKVFKPQLQPKEIQERPTTQLAILDNTKKKLFTVSFVLVITEEILRLVSYLKNPPFLAYLDGNVYVKAMNQFITPFYASLIVFALVCLTLFATTKLTSENQHMSSLYTNLFKRAIPICIFTVTSIIYIASITNWLFILA